MTTQHRIEAGFSNPVFQSQATFRALLSALSEPGLPCAIGVGLAPPAGLHAAAAAALLTLADYETPVWLPPALRDGAAGAWLRFHCGAALVERPAEAAFSVIEAADAAPLLSAFNPGTDQFPDRSATVIVQCADLAGGPGVSLAGPGISGSRRFAPMGLRPGFWTEVSAHAGFYPLGVDLILSHGATVAGLPRSTQVLVLAETETA